MKDIIGFKFGKLTVKEYHSTSRNGHKRYVCSCECGSTVNILATHLKQGNTKSCGCNRAVGKNHPQWGGFGDISGDFWGQHVVRSANGSKGKRKAIPLTLTIEEAWELFKKQDGKCSLSGLPLKFPSKSKDPNWSASLDRIDSSKGYELNNVQWVHKDINIMKNKFNNDYFINICKLIASNNRSATCEVK